MALSDNLTDIRSVLERLFDDGHFEHLIVGVFSFLDGPTLETCSVVCKKWRKMIKSENFCFIFWEWQTCHSSAVVF